MPSGRIHDPKRPPRPDAWRKHAELGSAPKAKRLFFLRFQRVGQPSEHVLYLSVTAAENKAKKLRAQGAEVALYVARVGPWEPLD